jgi:Cu2+-exporting ATPase
MEQTTAQRSESELQVVHAIPGRVRLRTTSSTRLISGLESLAQKLRQQDGVLEVETNPTTNSLVVTFKASSLSLPQMLEGLQANAKIAKASGKTAPLPELKSDSFLREQTEPPWDGVKVARSLIPLVAGMLATSALGVQGFMAFPVYLIAENLTRQVIEQIEEEISVAEQVNPSQQKATELNGKSATLKKEENPASPLRVEVAYSVVHAVPGRIRVRVPRIGYDSEYTLRLTVLTKADANVTDVRVNAAAASIAVSYAVSKISDEKMRVHLINLIQTASNPNIPLNLKAGATQQEPEQENNPWSGITLPAISATLALLGGPLGLPIPPVVIGGSIALSALPVAQRAFDSILNEQRLNIDFLDLAAITITTVQGQFISPAIMIVLVEIGEAIREQTARSSKAETLDLLDSLKQDVWVERNGEKHQISIHEVQPGDIVIVYPGDQIPVDGRIIRGKALIDEQKLTGESMPVMRHKGQTVYTSTLVREGQVYILTEHVGADTRAGQIIKVMQDAPVHDTRIENHAANFANQAVVPTLLLSGVVFALTRNFARAASILTLDFATGIRVSVPTTVLAALTYAARRGILIRSGRALEKLAQVDAVVFDKTGTLTRGEAVIVKVETEGKATSAMEVLELAASAEQRLTHPVAEAVVRYAEEQGAKILPREKFNYEIGQGVRAKIDGQAVLVGSEHFLRQEGVYLNGQPKKHERQNYSVIYVASNGELQGALAYSDPLRPESPEIIKALRTTEGMEIHLLTGDNRRTAHAVAGELGIEPNQTHAEAFPEQKVAVVKDLHDGGKTVAFVGDGINDSPALAYADVSVSFANGSDVARETADVVLMENNLRGLPEAIAIARQAMQLIHENTGIVAIPNLGALVLAVAIGIDPLAATLVNNGTTVVAGLNGLRPLLSEQLDQLAASLDTNGNDPDSETSQTLEEVTNGSSQQPTNELLESLEEPLETSLNDSNSVISESPNTLESTQAVSDSLEVPTEPLTAKALAHRLNVSATTISKRKSKPDFPEWARSKDPDGILWTYSKKSHHFVALAVTVA